MSNPLFKTPAGKALLGVGLGLALPAILIMGNTMLMTSMVTTIGAVASDVTETSSKGGGGCNSSVNTNIQVSQQMVAAMKNNKDAAQIVTALSTGNGVDLHGLTYNNIVIAGMLGNFEQESGVTFKTTQNHVNDNADNSEALNLANSGVGMGVGQWTGSRGYNLVNFAIHSNKNWYDGDLQIQNLANDMAGGYRAAYDGMNAANSPSESARIFHNLFEISADTSTQVREANAEAWYNVLKEINPSDMGSGGVTSASQCSTDGNASYGSVGGAPTDTNNFGWMCDWGHICSDGDGLGNRVTDKNFYKFDYGYQCVWYAWNRLSMIHGSDGWIWVQGNGGEVAPRAANTPGWTVSDAPKPGDGVSEFGGALGGGAAYGHIAVVEKVESDPSGWKIMISEGNYINGGTGSWNGYGTRWLTKAQFAGQGNVFFRFNGWK